MDSAESDNSGTEVDDVEFDNDSAGHEASDDGFFDNDIDDGFLNNDIDDGFLDDDIDEGELSDDNRSSATGEGSVTPFRERFCISQRHSFVLNHIERQRVQIACQRVQIACQMPGL